MSKISDLTDEQFQEIIETSENISRVLAELKLTVKGNSWGYTLIKQRMKDLGLDETSFRPKDYTKITHRPSPTNVELFTENSTYDRCIARNRILRDGLIEYKCEICGLSENWNGHQLSLDLDHINGINNDHRLDNLRFLCPNCHSQTPTHGSRNIKIKK